MIQNVLKTIKENNMFNPKDKVIVAVSGGPDSICLLHVLNMLKEELDIEIYAAHVNHCLRGDDADADEAYVKDFCCKLGLEFRRLKIDVHKIAKEKGLSCETAGRKIRYDFFEKIKEQVNAQKIAIAHNFNDQAETVLMRIMRGTGLDGMIGIRPVRDNVFVRPLINTTRDDIEAYCEKNNLSPRIDKTNLETIYSRNKVRLELIPYIQDNFNKDITKVLNRLSGMIKVDSEYLENISKEKYKKYCDIHKEKVIISRKAFLEHEAVISRILRMSIFQMCGNLYNFERMHIYDIINIQKHSTGKTLNLPQDVCVSNNYGDIWIYKNSNNIAKDNHKEYILKLGNNYIEDIKTKIIMNVTPKNEVKNLKNNNFFNCFDYDKLKNQCISLRYRRNGDRFTPLGMKGNKKIKDLFIDLKIPREERDNIPFICFGDEISWIVGYRVSELFKVDKNTKDILQISIEGEESNK